MDAVGSGVGVGSGGDDGEGGVVVGELGVEPVEVAQVALGDVRAEVGVDGDDAVGVFDDEVDVVAAAFGAEMVDGGVVVLGEHLQRECDE